jgi:site-specific recombinase XerD
MNNTPENYKYDADLIAYLDRIYGAAPRTDLLKKYILHLQGECGVSERTVKLYIKDLFGTYDLETGFIRSAEYTFFTFLSIRNVASHSQINREVIRDYLGWLYNHGIAKSSINRRLSALRSFYRFLLVEERIETSPLPVRSRQRNSYGSKLALKIDKKLPVFLTQPEMEKILNTPDLDQPAGRRDRALMELLYASGLRVSELWSLDLGSINLDNREARVIGKGAKERVVLMGMPAASALESYIRQARPRLLARRREKALFLNNHGKRLTVRGIQKILKYYAQANGLEKNVHPHVFRHTFATHMLDGGADLRVVQELLGHADLSSTQIYTHVTKQQARKVYLTTHPLAREKDNSDADQK